MVQDFKTVVKKVEEQQVEMIDLKFCDLFGRWHHISIPVSQLNESLFTQGVAFDGSSVPGFKKLEAGDMVLLPDTNTMLLDPFFLQSSHGLLTCRICSCQSVCLFLYS